MTKRIDSDLLLFVVNEFGELEPNLQYIQAENAIIQEKERIDNVSESKQSQTALEQSGVSNTNSMVDRQENRLTRTQSDWSVGAGLSKDDGSVGRIGTSHPSPTTSGDGAGNPAKQGSQRQTSSGINGDGDNEGSRDRLGILSHQSTQTLEPEISSSVGERPSIRGGIRGRDGSGQHLGISSDMSNTKRDETTDRRREFRHSGEKTANSRDRILNGQSSQQRGNGTGTANRRDFGESNSRLEGQSLFAARTVRQEIGGNDKGHNERESIQQTLNTVSQRSNSSDTSGKIDFTTNKEPNLGSLKEKFRKNVKAIALLKALENENRFATAQEQSILSEFSGWGGISMAFDSQNKEWQNEYKELLNLLDENEYKAARNSTQDAFYTPQIIIDTIYKGLNTLGFNTPEKKTIFEPSAGVGNFLAFAKNYADNYQFTCTELDDISARLLKKLYPNQDIRHHGFEKYNFVKQFDAFIGNPPFGQKKIVDDNLNLGNISVHNYFLAKSIDNLKEDGIAAFVVSKYFLDSQNQSVRDFINEKATFLGAVRLPNNAFSKIANTEVSTDILFFKKGKNANLDNKWLESKEYFDDTNEICLKNGFSEQEAKNFKINEYFKQNPQNILGKMKVVSSQFGFSLECVSDGRNLQTALNDFTNKLPKNVYQYHATKIRDEIIIVNKESPKFKEFEDKLMTIKRQNYFIYDKQVYIKISNSDEELIFKKPNLSENDKRKIIKFVQIRDEFNKLISLEKSNMSDDEIMPQRTRLNGLYDSFVRTEGFLNRDSNKKAFRDDIEANKILALEKNYNAGISKSTALKHGVELKAPSAAKSDIFYKRTIAAQKEFKISTPKEALIASVNEYGYLSLTFLEQKLDMKLEYSLKSLLDEKLIFVNHKDGEYILAEKYLSGNVKAKYKEVEELIKQGNNEHLRTNLESLKEILPKDLKATDISIGLGTTWIPLKYYQEFFEQSFGINKDMYDLFLNNKTGEWHFDGIKYGLSAYVRSQYATERIGAFELVEHGLQRKPIRIYDNVEDGDGKTKRILNSKETALANSKLEKLKNDFAEWIYKDYDRRVDLEKIYNERFNTDVEPKYNGSYLSLTDFNQNIKLKPHQKNAIYRAIQEQSVIFDHQVGAGKTLVSICALMEQKRMGLINKPLIIVPNHLAGQWNDEFYKAYPNANILVASKKDLEKNNREQFFSRVATNEYDAVIMTHSQFKLLPAPYENECRIIEEAIDALQSSITQKQSDDNAKRYSIKKLEQRVDNYKIKLENLIAKNAKSKAIDFSELGIDTLVVDEAHEFKNLLITTAMGDISGLGNLNGSQKAMDLYIKTDYIHENNHKLYFLTGTPISNSITELYTLQRYLQPQVLENKQIQSFDAWASTFGEVSNAWELDSSGINYKIVARFNKFKNVPELAKMYKSVADIVTNADIEKFQKDFVPKLHNNKPANEVVPRSEEVAEYIGIQDENGVWNEGSIVWRMEHQSDDIRNNNLLACTTDARKAGLDYRLINPNADDFKDSKINKLVENVYNEYLVWNDDKGTQLIFCDLSTPKTHSQKIFVDETQNSAQNSNNGIDKDEFININDTIEDEQEQVKSLDEILAQVAKFDVYSDILKKLIAKGVPQDEIRFIHDAKTDLQKQQLFADMNTGKVRVLIGSTQKMGAGTNVQKRVVAIHHLDCPWRPSDLEQRIGRVIRQGNELFMRDTQNFRIKEFRYATERTYDARMWQVIENKARSIEQFRKAGATTRTLDDISNAAADVAEMKAEATGNPFILMQVQLNSDLRQEELLYNNHQKELFHNEETLKNLKAKNQYLAEETEKYKVFKEILEQHKISNFKGSYYTHDLQQGSRAAKSFSILKDDNSEANKNTQELVKKAFEANVSLIAKEYEKEFDIFEYRGLVISGEKTSLNSLSFYVSTPDKKIFIEPHNMVYKRKDNQQLFSLESLVTFGGFVTRLNNFCNDIDKFIESNNENIRRLNKEIKELEAITGENAIEYRRKDYLEALREDNRLIIDEIEKSAKDKNYKSEFEPKSAKILQALNAKSFKNEEILR